MNRQRPRFYAVNGHVSTPIELWSVGARKCYVLAQLPEFFLGQVDMPRDGEFQISRRNEGVGLDGLIAGPNPPAEYDKTSQLLVVAKFGQI